MTPSLRNSSGCWLFNDCQESIKVAGIQSTMYVVKYVKLFFSPFYLTQLNNGMVLFAWDWSIIRSANNFTTTNTIWPSWHFIKDSTLFSLILRNSWTALFYCQNVGKWLNEEWKIQRLGKLFSIARSQENQLKFGKLLYLLPVTSQKYWRRMKNVCFRSGL